MMKKMMMFALTAILTLGLAACGSKPASQSASQSAPEPAPEATPANAGNESSNSETIGNPWTDVKTPEEAADGAGVGYFTVPEDKTETPRGPIFWNTFRCMKGVAEAQGSIGAASLTVRKGLKQDSTDVSGDYTEYKHSWTQKADDWDVSCYGNEEGSAMKMTWLSDNFSYSIMVRGQGDYYTTYGLCEEDVIALVTAIQ